MLDPNHPYFRIVDFFDRDETAGSFLSEDGEGGFTGAVYRMAREIDRLRSLPTITPAEVGGLVERLRSRTPATGPLADIYYDIQEAASLIQSQAARIAELEAGLEPFRSVAGLFEHMGDDGGSVLVNVSLGSLRTARALLNKETQG